MKRIYVDTEYMYDGMFYEKRMPRPSDKKQIIQIAAVLFDHSIGKEIKSVDILVKPLFHNKLPKFFIELTDINERILAKYAITFPKALKIFINFAKDYPIWTYNNDYHVFMQNLKYYSIANPFKKPFTRVKPFLKKYKVDSNKYSSGTLYRAAGINIKGHVHDALHDVRSMSQAMDFFQKKFN